MVANVKVNKYLFHLTYRSFSLYFMQMKGNALNLVRNFVDLPVTVEKFMTPIIKS